jgi:hypothetical protein
MIRQICSEELSIKTSYYEQKFFLNVSNFWDVLCKYWDQMGPIGAFLFFGQLASLFVTYFFQHK